MILSIQAPDTARDSINTDLSIGVGRPFRYSYYLLRQSRTHAPAIELLDRLSGMTEIVAVGEKIISQSLQSGFRDFEDAIQYYCALTLPGINGIVTRNMKDFSKSRLPVLTPQEALSLF